MPFLDAIPVNVFILGTSVLAGVILFLILWQIPDEEVTDDVIKEEDSKVNEPESKKVVEPAVKKSKPSKKK